MINGKENVSKHCIRRCVLTDITEGLIVIVNRGSVKKNFLNDRQIRGEWGLCSLNSVKSKLFKSKHWLRIGQGESYMMQKPSYWQKINDLLVINDICPIKYFLMRVQKKLKLKKQNVTIVLVVQRK